MFYDLLEERNQGLKFGFNENLFQTFRREPIWKGQFVSVTRIQAVFSLSTCSSFHRANCEGMIIYSKTNKLDITLYYFKILLYKIKF